jgi:S1-C subfamily serine protease
VGDIVTSLGPVPLSSQFGLLNALAIAAPDERVELEILRDGQPATVTVQLRPR